MGIRCLPVKGCTPLLALAGDRQPLHGIGQQVEARKGRVQPDGLPLHRQRTHIIAQQRIAAPGKGGSQRRFAMPLGATEDHRAVGGQLRCRA